MTRNLTSIFNADRFDRIFIRQLDEFSCAAASFATVARLYDLDSSLDLRFFRRALRVSMKGTDLRDMEKVCTKYMPALKMGNNIYHNGIALAFIQHKPDGDEHMVVFLARRDDTFIYYDPYDHRIFSDTTRNMRRSAPGVQDARWTANFPKIPGTGFDFWAARASPNPFRLQQQSFWLREHGLKPKF